MDIVSASSSGNVRINPSSVVIKREPLIDDLEDGAVNIHLPRYHHTDSVMQNVKAESTTSDLHGVMGSHRRFLQLSVPLIKQESLETDFKYPTPWPLIKVEDEQIPAIYESLSRTDDGIKGEKTDSTQMRTAMMEVLKVEDVRCEASDVHSPLHSRGKLIPKPPVPVTLYGYHEEVVNTAKNEQTDVGYCEIPLVAGEDCLGMQMNLTDTSTDSEPSCKLRCISGTSPHTDMSEPSNAETSECRVGYQKFATYDHLIVHLKSHTAEQLLQPFKCPVCYRKFASNGHLIVHLKSHKAENPFKCSRCNHRCAKKGDLKVHMVTHTGEKPFKCSLCDFRSARKENRNQHIFSHTGEKPFKCSLCDFRSARKKNLNQHIFSHTGEKPFKCSLCDFWSARKGNLTQHIVTHTGEKPFKCSRCDHRCATKGTLKAHMVTHTGEKPFKCSLCDFRSTRKVYLHKHIASHTGEKPFKCSLCDFRSACKWNLNEHIVSHTGEKSFECSVCNHRFAHKRTLAKHA